MTITEAFQAVARILETHKLSEIPEDELEYFPKIFSGQHQFMVKLMERWCEAEDNIQAKTEIIHALQKELTLQRGAVRDPAMIKLVTRPGSIASTETQTDANMDDLDADGLQLITARDEVLRLGNELVEKDNRITEYERVLHSQRQWAEREIEAKEEIIQALEKKLEVQGEKLVTRPRSTATTDTQTDLNMDHLDYTGANLIRARKKVLRLRNELMEKDELITEYESELHSQREQAKKDTQRNDEIIQALEKELDVLRKKIPRYSLQETQHKTDLTDTDMKAMQRDNEALKRKIEYLEGQCNNAEALKRRLKIVTAEQQRQEKVTNDMQLEMEHIQGQCKDNAALKVDRDRLLIEAKRQARCIKAIKEERDTLKLEAEHLRGKCKDAAELKEQRDNLILESKRQAANIVAIEEERNALKLEAQHLRGQCEGAEALKEELNITTMQHTKFKKGISALVVIVIMLIFFFNVALFWTLRDSPNTFTSLDEMSSFHNSVRATSMPFHNIVV